MKSYTEIIQECDNFPYYEPYKEDAYTTRMSSLWHFFLPEDSNPHGLLLDFVVERMPWTADFRLVTRPRKEVHLLKRDVEDWESACGRAIDEMLDIARTENVFPLLGRKRDEQFPILGAKFSIGIERSASSMFGIIGRGVHMTAYVRTSSSLKFWIPQRNSKKATYPNMLDNTVAGAVAVGETPFECLIREAGEEAALTEDFVFKNARAAGTVTWFNVSDEKKGGDIGLMNPGVLFVYDLEVPEDTIFNVVDNDVQAFHLMDIDEVKNAMRNQKFKPSCAMVMIDFFVRHGFISAEEEPEYVEIISRLHRKLPFATGPAT